MAAQASAACINVTTAPSWYTEQASGGAESSCCNRRFPEAANGKAMVLAAVGLAGAK